MLISEIKKQAKFSLKGKWGLAVLLTFIVFLVNMILPMIMEIILSGGFTQWVYQEEAPASASILSLIISFLLIPFSIAVYWFYLALVRNEGPQISDVFSIYKSGKTSLKLFGASILQGIYIFLWSILFLIPGIIKSMSYSQTFYLLKDHPEYTVSEAIRESKKRMKGLKGKYFLMGLSFIGWGILCILTLGIGFLWLIPYVTTSMSVFYNELVATREEI